MGFEDLTEEDERVYQYIRERDFTETGWSTPNAARELSMSEDDVRQSISNLTTHVRDHIWVRYRKGQVIISCD